MMPATSNITREVDRAFLLIGGMSLVLLIGITVAMVLLAVRFRRSRARTTTQFEGNTLLEITWTIIPTIIVIWMFFVGYKGFALMGRVPDDHMVVQVTGKQWVWSFSYPGELIDTTEMVVPVNKPVLVELTAPPEDVVHSFYLPDFRVKEDALPGQATSLWFEAEREGTYTILCAEFCGKDHSKMVSLLKVVSAEAYDRWVNDQQMKKYRPMELEAVLNPQHPGFGEDELNIDSEVIFAAFCASCHGATGDGSGLPGIARDLTSSDGWKRSPKVVDIYRTLTEGIEGTQMRAYSNFTPWERVGVAHYVRLFSKEPPPQDTPQDYEALVAEYGLDKVQAPKETIPIEQAMEILVIEAGSPESSKERPASAETP
ncbi:MAG: cytochrome c oxidase subunit II [Phycisphaerales bacterium]|nr:MAG: cytochrome c oxidase subunit II [Phycisphaerales bacterium]